MKIIGSFPPNYKQIVEHFPFLTPETKVVFTYGDTIWNPTGGSIPKHLEIHEATHWKQQEKIGIKEWWDLYCVDKEFRLSQELESYVNQYNFINFSSLPRAAKDEFLDKIAFDLSSDLYGRIINQAVAKSKIRNYGKIPLV